jgi:hypothetical protein
MTLAMSGAAPSDSGLASGLVNTTQQVGGALGLAVVATLSTSRSDGLLADGASAASSLTSGYHLAFGVGAGLVAAAVVVAAIFLRPDGGRIVGDPTDEATSSVGAKARSDIGSRHV